MRFYAIIFLAGGVLCMLVTPFHGWRPWAGLAIDPLAVGALAVALTFAAEPFAARKFLWVVPPAAVLLPGFQILGVASAAMLVLALLVAAAGFAARAWEGDTGHGFAAGLCGGLAVCFWPPAWVFMPIIFAALLTRWWGQKIGAAILACAAGFFDVLGFVFAVHPPRGGYGVPAIDRLSLVYVALGLFLLLGALALFRSERLLAAKRRAAGIGAIVAFFLLWLVLFAKILHAPYGLMGAAGRRAWFFADLAPGIAAVVYAVARVRTARTLAGVWLWLEVTLVGIFVIWLAQKFPAFVEFPSALAAVLLPIALTDMTRRLADRPNAAIAARVAIMVAVFVIPYAPALAAILKAG